MATIGPPIRPSVANRRRPAGQGPTSAPTKPPGNTGSVGTHETARPPRDHGHRPSGTGRGFSVTGQPFDADGRNRARQSGHLWRIDEVQPGRALHRHPRNRPATQECRHPRNRPAIPGTMGTGPRGRAEDSEPRGTHSTQMAAIGPSIRPSVANRRRPAGQGPTSAPTKPPSHTHSTQMAAIGPPIRPSVANRRFTRQSLTWAHVGGHTSVGSWARGGNFRRLPARAAQRGRGVLEDGSVDHLALELEDARACRGGSGEQLGCR
ncbi:hypothetical protein SRABI26_01673 [Arthrobacter sp. Bi26]|nr:hypothetical protein SRABI26_01673 [Arthrobacter sp. Bi26]